MYVGYKTKAEKKAEHKARAKGYTGANDRNLDDFVPFTQPSKEEVEKDKKFMDQLEELTKKANEEARKKPKVSEEDMAKALQANKEKMVEQSVLFKRWKNE